MALMGAFQANKAGFTDPRQICLPNPIIRDEGTNTQQPARELHLACRRTTHLVLYRKTEPCQLLSHNASYLYRWHIRNTKQSISSAQNIVCVWIQTRAPQKSLLILTEWRSLPILLLQTTLLSSLLQFPAYAEPFAHTAHTVLPRVL